MIALIEPLVPKSHLGAQVVDFGRDGFQARSEGLEMLSIGCY